MWKRVTLETTLKPFCFDMSDAGFRKKIAEILKQWDPLWLNNDAVPQIMLWVGDGSEILEYSGNDQDIMEYARYIGGMMPMDNGTHPETLESRSIHQHPRLFCENPPVWHYSDLKRLIRIMRQTARELYNRDIEIGTTFDPGPEFARSEFKYVRHPEILSTMHGGKMFLFCFARLHKDDHCYAAYPNGIPENESFGTFFGKQTQIFLTEYGLDFIWFSNGVGFGVDTWGMTGSVFNGKEFFPQNCHITGGKIFAFWQDFRRECPDFRIETRGTNMSSGIDLASDAVPLKDIYKRVPGLIPPPNSPWAALNSNFGLEMAGMMSHTAELPECGFFPYRFYTHDPWWDNSPWLDRYNRTPHDIYLAMAVSRVSEDGSVQNAEQLELLSIDNSYGGTPDQVPQECIPFLLDAERTAADQMGVMVWVYAFDEIHERVLNGGDPSPVFAMDSFIVQAINEGLPLNTVVSSRIFNQLPLEKFSGRILAAPTLLNDETLKKLLAFAGTGNTVLFYGAMENPLLLDYFGLEKALPLTGEMLLSNCGKVRANALYNGGAMDLVLKKSSSGKVLYEYIQGSEKRIAAVEKDNAIYIMPSSSIEKFSAGGSPEYLDRMEYFRGEKLFTRVLEHTPWCFRYESPAEHLPLPVVAVRVHSNAFYYSIYSCNTNVKNVFAAPDGAPVFRGRDLELRNGQGVYAAAKFDDIEARVFVRGEDSFISCVEMPPLGVGIKHQCQIRGLKNAVVTYRPPVDAEYCFASIERASSMYPVNKLIELRCEIDSFGVKYIAENISGTIHFWSGNQIKQYFPEKINQVIDNRCCN